MNVFSYYRAINVSSYYRVINVFSYYRAMNVSSYYRVINVFPQVTSKKQSGGGGTGAWGTAGTDSQKCLL